MPFPPNWPTYIPKTSLPAGSRPTGKHGAQLLAATEFRARAYDEREERWAVVLHRADGTTREMRPRHIVNGHRGQRNSRTFPTSRTLRNFGGKILHSSQYVDGEEWKGKKRPGHRTGNSGHDIAQDLYSSGAKVTLVQRSPTLIVNIEPSAANFPTRCYDEGPPLEDCDLINTSIPLPLVHFLACSVRACGLFRARGSGMEVLMRSQSSRGGPSSYNA